MSADPKPSPRASSRTTMGPHDHAECIAGVLREAEAAIVASGARLTPVRRRVLEILLESHTALGAYEILKRLSAEGFGDKPPVVYRALDFLREHRLAHKIERLNAFVACMHPAADHVPAFMICRDCRAVAETTSPAPLLAGDAAEIGFKIETTMVEAEGLCPKCQPK